MLDDVPVFTDLPPPTRAALHSAGRTRRVAAGEVIFYPGDHAGTLYLVAAGRVALSLGDIARGEAQPGQVLDLEAALGGMAHRVKATAHNDCELLCWDIEALWETPAFAAAACHYLSSALHAERAHVERLELASRVHHHEPSAALLPGPYIFEDVTMVFAFCEACPDIVRAALPTGLSLLRVPGPLGAQGAPVLLALTDFPIAYPAGQPDARMSPYTETTYFVPVRFGTAVGLYVAYIYPSAWEPVLLGREIYGFPKRLGKTTITAKSAALAVDSESHVQLSWPRAEPTGEANLVGALMDMLGLQKHAAALTFQAGEVIRRAMRLPGYRRVDVYNHKRVPAADTTYDNPTYVVDCLTRATFGVLRWHQVAQARDPTFEVKGGPPAQMKLNLRAAYRTRLDLKLGAGRVVKDFAGR